MTLSRSVTSSNVTNPNPLERPVSWFFITTQSVSAPYFIKYFCNEAEIKKNMTFISIVCYNEQPYTNHV
jgi:hypothetical protein